MAILARVVRGVKARERRVIPGHIEPRNLGTKVEHLEVREGRVVDGETDHKGAVDGDGRDGTCDGLVGPGVGLACCIVCGASRSPMGCE